MYDPEEDSFGAPADQNFQQEIEPWEKDGRQTQIPSKKMNNSWKQSKINFGGNNNHAKQLSNNQQFDHDQNFLLHNWGEYFPDAPKYSFDPDDFRHDLILKLYESYDKNQQFFKNLIEWGNDKKYNVLEAYINFPKLQNFPDPAVQEYIQKFSEFAGDHIACFSIVLEKIRRHKLNKPLKKCIARFYNLGKFYSINDIKSSMINHFISVKGVVLRTSPVRLLTTSMSFQCADCKGILTRKFQDGIFQLPTSCDDGMCRSKMFIPDKSSAKTILYQRVRIQEINDDVTSDNQGRIPKTIDVELKETLVNSVISGDIIVANGILKTEKADDSESKLVGGKNKVQGLFISYIDANSISNCKFSNKQYQNHQNDDEFSEDDMKIIEKLAHMNNLFPLLVKSFCPTIYGHELVKAGLILAIVGGSNLNDDGRNANNRNKYRSSMRPDCHVLLIGDPGQGKSQMLKFVSNIVPRGVYVCGNAATTAGLTVTVTKDSHTGEGSLEAGALVLSDQGVCCIDEFDKMSSEHLSLLEAMEQQTVSIAKSGVMCSLSTRTTILAAANPKGGSYNKAKNVKDNIKISNAILSRFDLIFLMLDHPDPKRDQKLSEHVMKLHNDKKRKKDKFEEDHKGGSTLTQTQIGPNGQLVTFSQFEKKFQTNYYKFGNNSKSNPLQNKAGASNPPDPSGGNNGSLRSGSSSNLLKPNGMSDRLDSNEKFTSLTERLTRKVEHYPKDSIIEQSIFRKYISYIKKNVHPKLSQEAAQVLKSFFISLRENTDTSSSLTTTTRQLESLIRLSQARAKIECRDEVTKEDAQDAVDLMSESLFDVLEDITGGGSIKGPKGKPLNMNNIGILSLPKQTRLFVDKLREEAQLQDDYLFEYSKLLSISKSLGMNVGDFSEYIDRLNLQGYLLKKNSKLYQLCSKF